MKVKCINRGNFRNLTVDKEYYCEENDSFYVVICDNGTQQNYSKRYFEVVPEPAIQDIDEVGVAEDEEKDIVIVEYVNSGGILISVNGEGMTLAHYNVAGNCGVYSFNGMNNLFDLCQNNKELFKKAVLAIIEVFENGNNGCMLIFSTNDEFYEIWEVLDEVMDTKSEALNNPNSNMGVKLWIKYAYHDKPEDENEAW